jgi:hypothetical protein
VSYGAQAETGRVFRCEAGFAFLSKVGERTELIFFRFVENCGDYIGVAAEELDSVRTLAGDEPNPLASEFGRLDRL